MGSIKIKKLAMPLGGEALQQGVVTPINIVLRAATRIVTPYTADVGVAYRITPYTTKKSRSHDGFLRRSQGHRQFSSAVTRYVTGSFWTVTNCDPGRSSKYAAYWSDHPLYKCIGVFRCQWGLRG